MLFVYFHVVSIVRVHSRDARSLIAEYDNAAGKIDGAIPVLSPLVSEAMGLLERAVMPANDPMADLYDAAVGMGKDGRDVGWRLELIETGDSRPMGEHTVLNVSYANAWIDGDTSLVEALMAAGLTEVQANEAAKAVNGGDDFGDAVLEQLTKGDGKVPLELLPLLASYLSEAEILNIQLRSEYEAELERLAEASEGLFDVNPFTIPFDEIDDRIEEVRRERNHWDPDVTLRADLEVEILTAIREGLEAEDGDFGFVLSPEDAVARRTDGQLEQTTALSEIFADDDNNLGDIATVLTDLNEIQLDQSAVQFEHALTHEPDFTDPADIAYTIAVTRAVLGVDELGNPQHDAEGLGVSEETFVTGYQNNTIAELVELELYAAGLSPVEYLTAQELDAISLLETHFHALMAIGAVQENPSNIPLVLIDGDQGYSLTWDQLVAIANGDHINEPLISDEYGNEPYFLADLLEYYDTVPGLTIDSLEDLQAIAQIIVANPRAFEALVGAHDGTEVIQGEELTGDLRGGVTAEDFAGFQSQERLRQLIGQLSGDIDSIKDGEEIDGDISAQDFALFILENPDIPAELKDQINQAIESGLTDQGGWEKIQNAFTTAGIVVGGLTLLALPGGNVVVLGGLAAAGVLIGAGEALAAHQNGDSEALAWTLVGAAFDLVDVTGAGGAAASTLILLGKLDLPADQRHAFEVILNSDKLRDLNRQITNGKGAWKPTDAAEYYNSAVDELVAAGFSRTEAERIARGHLAGVESGITHPKFNEQAFEQASEVFRKYPDDAELIRESLSGLRDPSLALGEIDDDVIAAMRFNEGRSDPRPPTPTDQRLRTIVDHHAFDKHVVTQGEFPGIRTKDQFVAMTRESIQRSSHFGDQSGTTWWYDKSQNILIFDTPPPHAGTVFRPTVPNFRLPDGTLVTDSLGNPVLR